MDTMLSKVLRDFMAGRHNQLLVNLAGKDARVWDEEFNKFLRKEPCWIKDSILKLISSFTMPDTTKKFIAQEKFVINTEENAPVRISYLDDDFKYWFLAEKGKIEDPITYATLNCHLLLKNTNDGRLIAELGGEARVEITLTEVYLLMEMQKSGEDGVLLNNKYSNIFYVADLAGVLRTVYVLWGGGGWRVSANPPGRMNIWENGRQVFSRNSTLRALEPQAVV